MVEPQTLAELLLAKYPIHSASTAALAIFRSEALLNEASRTAASGLAEPGTQNVLTPVKLLVAFNANERASVQPMSMPLHTAAVTLLGK